MPSSSSAREGGVDRRAERAAGLENGPVALARPDAAGELAEALGCLGAQCAQPRGVADHRVAAALVELGLEPGRVAEDAARGAPDGSAWPASPPVVARSAQRRSLRSREKRRFASVSPRRSSTAWSATRYGPGEVHERLRARSVIVICDEGEVVVLRAGLEERGEAVLLDEADGRHAELAGERPGQVDLVALGEEHRRGPAPRRPGSRRPASTRRRRAARASWSAPARRRPGARARRRARRRAGRQRGRGGAS